MPHRLISELCLIISRLPARQILRPIQLEEGAHGPVSLLLNVAGDFAVTLIRQLPERFENSNRQVQKFCGFGVDGYIEIEFNVLLHGASDGGVANRVDLGG